MYSIDLPGLKVLAVRSDPVFERGIANAAGAHFNEYFRDIKRAVIIFQQNTEHKLIICCRTQGAVKETTFIIYRFPYKKSRMRGHPAIIELFLAEGPGLPCAGYFAKVVESNILEIAVHGLYQRVFESCCHFTDHPFIDIDVIRVEDADDIARGHPYAFIHSIVYAAILFGDYPGNVGVRIDDFQRCIPGSPIDYQMFNISIILAFHRFQGIPDGKGRIIGGGDNGEFHKLSALPDRCKLLAFSRHLL